ncbi:MAG: hypothetical protein DWQ53_09235 [Microcystis flos-aquae DF17]|nr:MAG: hypothetical protein DWQ53_09235 [Microcystis flos-aquae DF17]
MQPVQFGNNSIKESVLTKAVFRSQESVFSIQYSGVSIQLSAFEGKRQQARGKRQNLTILLPKKKVRN